MKIYKHFQHKKSHSNYPPLLLKIGKNSSTENSARHQYSRVYTPRARLVIFVIRFEVRAKSGIPPGLLSSIARRISGGAVGFSRSWRGTHFHFSDIQSMLHISLVVITRNQPHVYIHIYWSPDIAVWCTNMHG